MTVASLTCDVCGRALGGSVALDPERSSAAVRLMIHPGDPLHKEDGILVCRGCWEGLRATLGAHVQDACAVCGVAVTYEGSLHVLEMTGRFGEAPLWQLCRQHGVEFLNGFRFIEPKLTPETLALRSDFSR